MSVWPSKEEVQDAWMGLPEADDVGYWNFYRGSAVDYAYRYYKNPNNWFYLKKDSYRYYPGADCTNFVSQVWAYAGIPMSKSWHSYHYLAGDNFWITRTWWDAEEFANYMVYKGFCEPPSPDNTLADVVAADLGDVIQFHDGKVWCHSAIITKANRDGTPNGICYTQHSTDDRDRPLSAVWPYKGLDIRILRPRKALPGKNSKHNFGW